MKKIIFMCGLAATLFSCAKVKHPEPLVSADPVDVVLNIEADAFGAETKATDTEAGSAAENAIKTIEVFAFNEHGKLAGYQQATSTANFKISVVPGTITFHALANQPTVGISSVGEKSALLAKSANLAATYTVAASGVPMYGESAATAVTASGVTASITLTRNLSRLDVLKISNTTDGVLGVNPIQVKQIWLTNVVGSYKVNGLPVASLWYNKVGSAIDAASSEYVRTLNQTLAKGASYSTAQHFYACPNSNIADAPATWAAAATYFNLSCEISGDLYNFNFKLPALAANNVYKINEVKVSGTGALAQATLTFTVGDWTTQIVGTTGVVEFGN